jgi:hypothetical protein
MNKYSNLCKDKKKTDIKKSGGLRANDEFLTTFTATFCKYEIRKY